MKKRRAYINWRSEWALVLSIGLLLLAPFLGDCVKAHLFPAILQEAEEALSLYNVHTSAYARADLSKCLTEHLIWLEWGHRVAQAFILLPLYHSFNEVAKNKQTLYRRARDGGYIAIVIYAAMAAVVMQSMLMLVLKAEEGTQEYAKAVLFLRLETVGAVLGFLVNYVALFLTVMGKAKYLMQIAIVRVVMESAGTFGMGRIMGLNGIVYADVIASLLLIAFSLWNFKRWDFVPEDSESDLSWMKEWALNGLFAGMRCLLVGMTFFFILLPIAQADSCGEAFLIACSFAWGMVLIPITAVATLIKRNGEVDIQRQKKKVHLAILMMLGTIPIWRPAVQFAFGLRYEDAAQVVSIMYILLPFFIAYGANEVIQGAIIAEGIIPVSTLASMFGNGGYYIIMLGLMHQDVFQPTIQFCLCLFGGGIAVNTIATFALYIYSQRWMAGQCELKANTDGMVGSHRQYGN